MVSEIVGAYIYSKFRDSFIRTKRKCLPAHINIESATITYGRPEDDEKIIDFLERLGDVEVEILHDEMDRLAFKYGTFDNWISMDEFHRICKEYTGDLHYDFYYHDGKIMGEPPRDDLIIEFNPINLLFEIKDGPHFPPIILETDLDEFMILGEWLKKGIRRFPLEVEKPISVRTLQPYTERRAGSLLVVAEDHDFSITITETFADRWVTRRELVDELRELYPDDGEVVYDSRCYKISSLRNVDISNIASHGVINNHRDIRLQGIIPREVFYGAKMKFNDSCFEYRHLYIARDEP